MNKKILIDYEAMDAAIAASERVTKTLKEFSKYLGEIDSCRARIKIDQGSTLSELTMALVFVPNTEDDPSVDEQSQKSYEIVLGKDVPWRVNFR